MTAALEGGEWSAARPGRTLPPGKSRYPFYRRLGAINLYIKVKWSRYRPGVDQRVGRIIALLFHDHGTRRGWVVSSTPRSHFTPGKDPVPILQEAGYAPGRSGRAENLVPTGIRSRTIQPVVSRWATRPTNRVTNVTKTQLDSRSVGRELNPRPPQHQAKF